jgi:hypothetical protein
MSWGNQETTEEMIEKLVDSGLSFEGYIFKDNILYQNQKGEYK